MDDGSESGASFTAYWNGPDHASVQKLKPTSPVASMDTRYAGRRTSRHRPWTTHGQQAAHTLTTACTQLASAYPQAPCRQLSLGIKGVIIFRRQKKSHPKVALSQRRLPTTVAVVAVRSVTSCGRREAR